MAERTHVIPSEREESVSRKLEQQIPHYVRNDSLCVASRCESQKVKKTRGPRGLSFVVTLWLLHLLTPGAVLQLRSLPCGSHHYSRIPPYAPILDKAYSIRKNRLESASAARNPITFTAR
jgi:hypothetical protein